MQKIVLPFALLPLITRIHADVESVCLFAHWGDDFATHFARILNLCGTAQMLVYLDFVKATLLPLCSFWWHHKVLESWFLELNAKYRVLRRLRTPFGLHNNLWQFCNQAFDFIPLECFDSHLGSATCNCIYLEDKYWAVFSPFTI